MVNNCTFIGRLGKDPEIRDLQSGDKLATFSMALSKSWKDRDGNKQEKTTWINCSVFGKQAEVIQKYVKKGDLLYIDAEFQVDEYEKDGQKRQAHKFVVKNFTMLGSKGESQAPSGETHPSMRQPEPPSYSAAEVGEDELPF